MTCIVEGKTKRIFDHPEDPTLCIIESKTDITANDDPSLTKSFDSKSVSANITTTNVFELLKSHDIPVAYQERLSDTSFSSKLCEMIPLEVIARRYALGSYLLREPDYKIDIGFESFKFNDLLVEFFLKTTNGKAFFSEHEIISGLDIEDPYIDISDDDTLCLRHPKLPYYDNDSFISDFEDLDFKVLEYLSNIDGGSQIDSLFKYLQELTTKVFEVLEAEFSKNLVTLIDFKIEFGITMDGHIVVADVIDNDSWRIEINGIDHSKQSFRDGESLDEVEKKYVTVMDITKKFLVAWF